MKVWNKPFRVCSINGMRRYRALDKKFKTNNRHYGVTNWMVGNCDTPLKPWVQIHIGYFCIQVKWYIVVILFMILSFVLGAVLL